MKNTYVIGLLLLSVIFTGCANKKVNQYHAFSQAGQAYSDAIIELTQQAGNAAIDADSQILIQLRKSLDQSDRSNIYPQHTNELVGILSNLRIFREHTGLLKKYFGVLSTLSEQGQTADIDTSTNTLVTALTTLSPSLINATVGGSKVSDLIKASPSFLIGSFQNKALENELKINARTIERELSLQQAYLNALAKDLESDLQAVINTKAFQEVATPYINSGNLPKGWAENRRQSLSSIVVMGSVNNAKKAADDLNKLFVALVSNKATDTEIEAAFGSINEILDLVEMFKSNT